VKHKHKYQHKLGYEGNVGVGWHRLAPPVATIFRREKLGPESRRIRGAGPALSLVPTNGGSLGRREETSVKY